ncbi:hypothetical protein TWF694_001496 [Orbilia ellipsospora]|uniref:C2H2-type domain-containing protein n=1 Tax=Orbilia ellipsospora TaxID=2528407 RepID=A0AAV9XUB1_9PEZI
MKEHQLHRHLNFGAVNRIACSHEWCRQGYFGPFALLKIDNHNTKVHNSTRDPAIFRAPPLRPNGNTGTRGTSLACSLADIGSEESKSSGQTSESPLSLPDDNGTESLVSEIYYHLKAHKVMRRSRAPVFDAWLRERNSVPVNERIAARFLTDEILFNGQSHGIVQDREFPIQDIVANTASNGTNPDTHSNSCKTAEQSDRKRTNADTASTTLEDQHYAKEIDLQAPNCHIGRTSEEPVANTTENFYDGYETSSGGSSRHSWTHEMNEQSHFIHRTWVLSMPERANDESSLMDTQTENAAHGQTDTDNALTDTMTTFYNYPKFLPEESLIPDPNVYELQEPYVSLSEPSLDEHRPPFSSVDPTVAGLFKFASNAYYKLKRASATGSNALQTFVQGLKGVNEILRVGCAALQDILAGHALCTLRDIYCYLHVAYAMYQLEKPQQKTQMPLTTFKEDLNLFRDLLPQSSCVENQYDNRDIFDEIVNIMWTEFEDAINWNNEHTSNSQFGTGYDAMSTLPAALRKFIHQGFRNDGCSCSPMRGPPPPQLVTNARSSVYEPTTARESFALDWSFIPAHLRLQFSKVTYTIVAFLSRLSRLELMIFYISGTISSILFWTDTDPPLRPSKDGCRLCGNPVPVPECRTCGLALMKLREQPTLINLFKGFYEIVSAFTAPLENQAAMNPLDNPIINRGERQLDNLSNTCCGAMICVNNPTMVSEIILPGSNSFLVGDEAHSTLPDSLLAQKEYSSSDTLHPLREYQKAVTKSPKSHGNFPSKRLLAEITDFKDTSLHFDGDDTSSETSTMLSSHNPPKRRRKLSWGPNEGQSEGRQLSSPENRRYHCNFEGCGTTFTKLENRNRHHKSHRSQVIYTARCQYPGCKSKRSAPLDSVAISNLQLHQRSNHSEWFDLTLAEDRFAVTYVRK